MPGSFIWFAQPVRQVVGRVPIKELGKYQKNIWIDDSPECVGQDAYWCLTAYDKGRKVLFYRESCLCKKC